MVSPGVAVGQVYRGGPAAVAGQGTGSGPSGPAGPDEVRAAFAAVAAERFSLAERLRREGRDDQAAIVEIAGVMAGDPTLVETAVDAVTAGTGAVDAVTGAAAAQADILAALPNEDLAARADDVRQVGQAVVAQLTSAAAAPPPAGDFVLIQREVDPAHLIRLADEGLVGAVSVTGGASSHAAIIARGLGLPMLAGVDAGVLDLPAGRPVLLDAADPDRARLVLDPDPQSASVTPIATGDAAATQVHRTADGQEVTLLVNAASAREVRMGLAGGAAGVGLLRTEIPFVGATAWPTQAEHRAALTPPLELLAGRPAVVRLLDFSGDKVPPFLAGTGPANGLTALLAAPEALNAQLRAILAAGRDTELRIMVPMVTTVAELTQVQAALNEVARSEAADQEKTPSPLLGMMVEVESTAAGAAEFTGTAGFFSIGTNDLTSEVLGIDRADPRMRPGLAADPRVLGLLRQVVTAAADRRIPVSVCGDAAADPEVLPLLLGLGIRTFSVGAARLPQVAAWVAAADTARATEQAAAVLNAAPVRPA
jgi:phosphoenolpyruvate-protein kinase (PTS system EI component)